MGYEKVFQDALFSKLDCMEKEMVKTLSELVALPAIGPENGGEGEWPKCRRIEELLRQFGIEEITHYDAPDPRVKCGFRPNMVARVPGNKEHPRLWLISHIDVVPPGDLELWNSDPFTAVEKDGKIFGRGTEDNGQELVASIYGIKAVLEGGETLEHDVMLCFVSDEETGSKYGLAHLLDKDLFRSDDLIVITDAGNSDGTMLEVAEKSIIWLKVKVKGEQAHASLPNKALNALTSISVFIGSISEEANKRFPLRNQIYDVPWSSFEPTKIEGGVDSINTIPGEITAYFDCRILPEYELEDVLEFFREKAEETNTKTGAEVEIDTIQCEVAAPPTSPEAPIVGMLKNAVETVHRNNPKPCGIGGGTVAALLRKRGLQVVAWGKIDDMAHAPNEYSRTKNLVEGAKVYALLSLEK